MITDSLPLQQTFENLILLQNADPHVMSKSSINAMKYSAPPKEDL